MNTADAISCEYGCARQPSGIQHAGSAAYPSCAVPLEPGEKDLSDVSFMPKHQVGCDVLDLVFIFSSLETTAFCESFGNSASRS
jgi:hypothetical protein